MSRNFSETEKHRILGEWEKSGMTIPAYSRQSGYSDTSLYRWRDEYRRREFNDEISANTNRQEFVELEVSSNSYSYYEIQRGDTCLKIPSSEKTSRITEIFRSLTSC
jgi:transposase-like protein